MRDLEGDMSILQRVVEFLPIEQLYKEKSHTVKAVSRAWRTAARRALTRGRWKPLRTLEDRGKRELWLAAPELRPNVPGAHSAFNRDAREAWALYPGEVLLLILNCNTLAGCDYLSLVVAPTKQGYGSVGAALEKMLQLERRYLAPAPRGCFRCLLVDWSRQAMPGSLPNGNMWVLSERLATPARRRRARPLDGPGLGGKVADVLIEITSMTGTRGTTTSRAACPRTGRTAGSGPASWLGSRSARLKRTRT